MSQKFVISKKDIKTEIDQDNLHACHYQTIVSVNSVCMISIR